MRGFDIQWSTNIVSTAVVAVLAVGIAFVDIEYRSFITTINWFSDYVVGRGLIVSIAT